MHTVSKHYEENRQFAGMCPQLFAIIFVAFAFSTLAPLASAQDTIYRCPGNEYTNNAKDALSRGCKTVEGGNITIVSVPSPRPTSPSVAPRAAAREGAVMPVARTDSADQRARDSDALQILRTELRKTEERLAELKREYNNGDMEKRGEEFRNHQKFLDRGADLKASILRAEADVNGLRREIERAGGGAGQAAPISAGAPR
jgi:hypothetical protein